MPSYKETFPNPHTVLPVIHVQNEKQTLKNAQVAREKGADGIFLISMNGMNHKDLLEMHKMVKNEFSAWFVGVNLLDVPSVRVFNTVDNNIPGVWSDNARITEWQSEQVEAEIIKKSREQNGWDGIYFGGVAFKYQRQVDNVALAAEIAKKYVDVITTSGSGTGSAPDVEKIVKMKVAIGNHPLAIASGISIDNVEKFKPHTDCFIVATSLLTPGTEDFDPSRIHDLIQTVKG